MNGFVLWSPLDVGFAGNFRIGDCSRVAGGPVALKDVPPCMPAAEISVTIVGNADCFDLLDHEHLCFHLSL